MMVQLPCVACPGRLQFTTLYTQTINFPNVQSDRVLVLLPSSSGARANPPLDAGLPAGRGEPSALVWVLRLVWASSIIHSTFKPVGTT
jgi:hypothetical protein